MEKSLESSDVQSWWRLFCMNKVMPLEDTSAGRILNENYGSLPSQLLPTLPTLVSYPGGLAKLSEALGDIKLSIGASLTYIKERLVRDRYDPIQRLLGMLDQVAFNSRREASNSVKSTRDPCKHSKTFTNRRKISRGSVQEKRWCSRQWGLANGRLASLRSPSWSHLTCHQSFLLSNWGILGLPTCQKPIPAKSAHIKTVSDKT